MYMASSAVARGIIPGSVKLVFNNVDITNMKRMTVTTGINGLTFSVKSGTLELRKIK